MGDSHKTRWNDALAELNRFVAEHGHALVPRQFVSPNGFNLGFWVNRHRRSYRAGTMPEQLADALAAVPGWGWSNPRDTWNRGFTELRAFAAEHGHSRVPQRWVTPDGFWLGTWVLRRRRDYRAGALDPDRAAELEAVPGWVWSHRESRWQHTLDELTAFADTFWHTSVPREWVSPSGYGLGNRVWYLRHLYASGSLPRDRAERLEMFPNWVWDAKDGRWAVRYAELQRYVADHGDARVPYRWVSESGFGLGVWVDTNRQQYRRGELSAERSAQLEAQPGWHWSRRENQWDTGLAELQRYVAEHGTANPPCKYVSSSGFALGNWVRTRLADHRHGKLPPAKVAALEALPGWTWSKSSA